MDVSGTVSIDGGTLSTYLPQALYYNGFAWTVIEADGGVSGNFANIHGQPDSQTLYLVTVNHGQSLSVEIRRNSFGDFASTTGGRAVGLGLDAIVAEAKENGDAMADMLLAMDWSYSAEQIKEALEAMGPDNYLAYARWGLQTAALFAQAGDQRMADMRRAHRLGQKELTRSDQILLAMAGDNPDMNLALTRDEPTNGWNLWAKLLNGWGELEQDGEHIGQEYKASGVAAGADGGINSWLSAGFSLGYTQGDLDWSASRYSGDMVGMHAGLYAQGVYGRLYANAMLTASRFENRAERAINFSDYSATAKGEFESYALQGRVETGYQFQGDGWLLTPLVALRHGYLYEEGFSMKRASARAALVFSAWAWTIARPNP